MYNSNRNDQLNLTRVWGEGRG